MKTSTLRKRPTKQPCTPRSKKANYSTYIYRCLKEAGSIAVKPTSRELFEVVASEAARLSLYNTRRTITSREIHAAMRLLHKAKRAGTVDA
nr:PREDICTED: histone H2B type 1-A-like [Lepisosteus oculatus]